MAERRGLGEILRQADLITEGQLTEALRLQKVHGERLASILVRQRVLTEKFAVTYLGRQIGVPAVDLSKIELHTALFERLPLDICQKHLVLPIGVEGQRLQVAMSDPTDQKLVSHLEFLIGSRVAPVVALESSLKNALYEARRALREGHSVVKVDILQQAPLSKEPTPPSEAAPPSAEAPPREPIPQVFLTAAEEQAAVFETLGGASLPMKPASAPPPPTPPPTLPAVEEMQTVLVVDDSELALRLVEGVLKGRGYRVLTAKTGREGLAKMRETVPDLVILDGMLPEVHGFEICRQIKTSERLRHIPVILLSAVHTGWRFASDVKEKYGADDYLTKPFESADLLRRVQALLTDNPAVPPHSEAAVRQHLKEGVTALKADHFDEAASSFERGLAIDQFSDMLHFYLAMTFEKQGRVFDAIDHYEKTVQLNPQFFDAIAALANLYQRQEFWRKAREMWELALEASKDEPVRARIKEHLLSLL